jgi:hypothetical protein
MAGAFDQFQRPDDPQIAGSAFEPVTWQQQLGNYKQLEGQEGAWRSAEGSPWKPKEPGAFAKMAGDALTSKPGQRLMDLANFIGPGPKGIKAFHVSPHKFDKFDLSKGGTGEGNMVYGHGVYAAESPAVSGKGGHYYNQFKSDPRYLELPDGTSLPVPKEGLRPGMPAEDRARYFMARRNPETPVDLEINRIEGLMRRAQSKSDPLTAFQLEGGWGDVDILKQTVERMKELKAAGAKPRDPLVYEMSIRADPRDFLDWDLPVSQQPKNVQEAIQGLGVDLTRPSKWHSEHARLPSGNAEVWRNNGRTIVKKPDGTYGWGEGYGDGPLTGNYKSLSGAQKAAMRNFEIPSRTGNEVMNDLKMRISGYGPHGDPRVTQALKDKGLAGIRYRDADSRGKADGTYNYVVKDDSIIDILKRYGMGGAAIGGAAAASNGGGDGGGL